VASSEIDLRHGIVPNQLMLAGVLGGISMQVLDDPESLIELAGAGAAAFVLLFVLREGSRVLLGRPGLGMGDVKLLMMISVFMGWHGIWAFFLAVMLGGAAGLAGIASGKWRRTTRIPFAPFVAMGVGWAAFLCPVDVFLWFS